MAKFTFRQSCADFFESSPRHHAFRRAHQTREADYTDAFGTDFSQSLDYRLAIGPARWPNIPNPILRQRPPFDFIGAANNRRNFTFQREDGADFRLGAADLRDVSGIGAELIPMSFVREADESVKTATLHLLAEPAPAAIPLVK